MKSNSQRGFRVVDLPNRTAYARRKGVISSIY